MTRSGRPGPAVERSYWTEVSAPPIPPAVSLTDVTATTMTSRPLRWHCCCSQSVQVRLYGRQSWRISLSSTLSLAVPVIVINVSSPTVPGDWRSRISIPCSCQIWVTHRSDESLHPGWSYWSRDRPETLENTFVDVADQSGGELLLYSETHRSHHTTQEAHDQSPASIRIYKGLKSDQHIQIITKLALNWISVILRMKSYI